MLVFFSWPLHTVKHEHYGHVNYWSLAVWLLTPYNVRLYMLLAFEVLVLVGLSAIFSGLNIGLMSLPLNDLKRKAKLGDWRAKRVLPLRHNTHLTLASILLSNVAVISTTSLVLDKHFSGLVAGLASTLLIVVFGEVLPQATFARFALSFCSYFSPFLRIAIILTYPVAKPLQLLLDKIIGNNPDKVHTRGELGMIINEQLLGVGSELDENEAEIMQSVLMLSHKRVSQILTPLDRVYFLKEDMVVDGPCIDDIKNHNYSRIPVFNHDATECVSVLLMKDLVDIDFDERASGFGELPMHTAVSVGSKTALDTLFKKFIAAKTHLMLVTRDEHIIGIVTIEDLIEEILGHEIEDEADRGRVAV